MSDKMQRYIEGMFPRAWTAVLRNAEEEAYRNGYDDAMRDAQRDLRLIFREGRAEVQETAG